MRQLVSRLGHWLSERRSEHEAVAERALHENMRRIRWAALAMLPLSLAGAVMFFLGPGADAPDTAAWRRAVGWTFVAAAATMPLLAWAAHRAAQQRPTAASAGWIGIAAFACALGYATAFVTVDQAVTPSVTPFALGCVFAGVILLLRPLTAVLLYAAGYAVFHVSIELTQHDATLLMSGRADALGGALLGLLVSMLLWHTHTSNELLRRRLEHSGQALREQQQRLEYQATHDPLTGLYNRREFTRHAEVEVLRAQRYRLDLSLIVLDLDGFKSINDQHGHPVGDRLLRHIAALLGGTVRGTDMIARLGGDEFIMLLSHTPAQAALVLAEKLRQLLEGTPLDADGLQLRLSASFGVAALAHADPMSFTQLYAEADRALYAAKRGGRNRVVSSAELPEAAAAGGAVPR